MPINLEGALPSNPREVVTSVIQEAINSPAAAAGGAAAGAAGEAVKTVVSVLQGVIDQTAEELEQQGISEAALGALTGEEQTALLDFVTAVKSLKEHEVEVQRLDEQVRLSINRQPFQVSARIENVQLFADLYAAMLRADQALKLALKTLKTLLQLFPEATPELEKIDPSFPAWLNSA